MSANQNQNKLQALNKVYVYRSCKKDEQTALGWGSRSVFVNNCVNKSIII